MRSTAGDNLSKLVCESLDRCGVDRTSRLLLAFSGGGDSSALLVLLHRIVGIRFASLTAAYLNHRLQPGEEQLIEERKAENLCRRLGVGLLTETLDAGHIEGSDEAAHYGIEAAARKARYDFLYRRSREAEATHVVTAHHAGDQLETIVMRLFSGARFGALKGIEECREARTADGYSLFLLRPLLSASPEAIREFLEEEEIAFHRDTSNADRRYLRNRIRHDLLPFLQETLPGYETSLLSLSDEARQIDAFLSETAARHIPADDCRGGVVFSGEAFWQAAVPLRRAAVYSAIRAHLPLARRVSGRHLAPLWSRVPPEGETRLEGHGLEILISPERVLLRSPVVRSDKKGYFLSIRGLKLPAPVTFRITEPLEGSGFVDVCCGHVVPPLVVRTRRPGDRLEKAGRSISVKRLLSATKLSSADRESVPIVEDGEGILAVIAPRQDGEIHLAARCELAETPHESPDIVIDVSENGCRVENVKRQ